MSIYFFNQFSEISILSVFYVLNSALVSARVRYQPTKIAKAIQNAKFKMNLLRTQPQEDHTHKYERQVDSLRAEVLLAKEHRSTSERHHNR